MKNILLRSVMQMILICVSFIICALNICWFFLLIIFWQPVFFSLDFLVLDCNPSLPDIKELIHELNKTNGLFKLVRIMRRRFQEAAAEGVPWIFNFLLERYFSTKRLLYVCYFQQDLGLQHCLCIKVHQ